MFCELLNKRNLSDLDKEGAEPPKPNTLTEKMVKDFKAMLRMPMPADIVNFKSKGAKAVYDKSRSMVKPLNVEWLLENGFVKFSSPITDRFVLFKGPTGVTNAFIGEHNEYNQPAGYVRMLN